MSVSAPSGRIWKHDVAAAARPLAAAVTAGFIAGLAIGGVGGRLAMFVLRLTSDPALRGLKTDDDFTIGIFSGATLFLVFLTAIAGAVGGLVYLAVRAWLPERARPWLFATLTGVVGGALVIRPDGIDFTLLEPLWLAVVMFVALPASYGVAVSLLAERFLASHSAFTGPWAWVAGLVLLLPLGLFGPAGVAVLAVIVAALFLSRSAPQMGWLWTSGPFAWIGRAVLAAVAVVGAASLVRDVTEIL
ncbi:MAG: hypothetical protein ACRDH0_09205 [Actinomycetota bacterium]